MFDCIKTFVATGQTRNSAAEQRISQRVIYKQKQALKLKKRWSGKFRTHEERRLYCLYVRQAKRWSREFRRRWPGSWEPLLWKWD